MINATPVRPLATSNPWSSATVPGTSATSNPSVASKPPVATAAPTTATGGVSGASNSFSTKPKRNFNFKMIGGLFVLLVVLIGGGVGLFLSQQSQDNRQQACDWVQTPRCGGGCRDYFDNGRQECYLPIDNGGGTQPTQPPGGGDNTPTCGAGSASACSGVRPNGACKGFAGTCLKNGGTNSAPICGCVPDAPLPNALLPVGSNCMDGGSCQSGICRNNLCADTTASPGSRPSLSPGQICDNVQGCFCGDDLVIKGSRCDSGASGGGGDGGRTTLYACSTVEGQCSDADGCTCPANCVNSQINITQTCGGFKTATGANKNCFNSTCGVLTINATLTCPTTHPLSSRPASCGSTSGGGPVLVTGDLCRDSGVPVKKYIKFTCPNGCPKEADGIFRCYENREDSTTLLKLDGACGQVDQLYGDSDATYCGYTEYNCDQTRCQKSDTPVPPSTPTPSKPPHVTPPPGPLCLNVSLRQNGQALTPSALASFKPKKGDSIQIACGQVTGASRYIFRIVEPDGVIVNLTGIGNVSASYTISKAGKFNAQCQICIGNGDQGCYDFSRIR